MLVDPKPRYPAKPVIGLKVDPYEGEPFIMPITFKAAKDMAMNILKTLLVEAPELFY